jgi:hypothetical protein
MIKPSEKFIKKVDMTSKTAIKQRTTPLCRIFYQLLINVEMLQKYVKIL